MDRDRSRSRDPEKRLRNHILQCVPPSLDLKMFGLYFFSTFSGTGIPSLALFHALRILWAEGICVQFRGGCHYEPDDKCERMSQAINKHNPLKTIHRYDVAAFTRDANGVQVLCKTKVLTTIASPCQKISQGIHHGNSLATEVGPHAFPSSLFWTAHAGIVSMSATVPMKNQIVVSEMVPAALSNWEEQFTAAVGPAMEVNTITGADRKRFFRTSPKVPLPLKILDTSSLGYRKFPDGCTWPYDSYNRKPPTLRAIYPVLLERQAMKSISTSDAQTLQHFRLTKQDGTLRYAGPIHLAQWLELPESVIDNIEEAYPCETQPFDPLQKFTAAEWKKKCSKPPDPSLFSLCGDQVLCINCTEAAELLGRAWNFSSAVSVLTATIRAAFANIDQAAYTDVSSMCPHFCGPSCAFVHTLEQVKGRSNIPNVSVSFINKQKVCLP